MTHELKKLKEQGIRSVQYTGVYIFCSILKQTNWRTAYQRHRALRKNTKPLNSVAFWSNFLWGYAAIRANKMLRSITHTTSKISWLENERGANVQVVQSVLTKDPADFRPNFHPLWILAASDNDDEPQHCRYRRKSSAIAQWLRHVHVPPCYCWLPISLLDARTSFPGLSQPRSQGAVGRTVAISLKFKCKFQNKNAIFGHLENIWILHSRPRPTGATQSRIRLARSPPEFECGRVLAILVWNRVYTRTQSGLFLVWLAGLFVWI